LSRCLQGYEKNDVFLFRHSLALQLVVVSENPKQETRASLTNQGIWNLYLSFLDEESPIITSFCNPSLFLSAINQNGPRRGRRASYKSTDEMMKLLFLALILVIILAISDCYEPKLPHKIASRFAKGERRAYERAANARDLCTNCHRPPVQCVCPCLPSQRIGVQTDILILQHPAEFRRKTISTVPLLKLVLERVQICVGHQFDLSLKPLAEAISKGHNIFVLFPGPDAISLDAPTTKEQPCDPTRLSPILGSDDKEDNNQETNDVRRNFLILFDGTWTQARKMALTSPELLEHCQQVQFASDSASLYDGVREQPEPHCRSTLEACAQALVLLEPHNPNATLAQDYLHAALQSLVRIQLMYLKKSTKSEESPDQSGTYFASTRREKKVGVKQERLYSEDEILRDDDRQKKKAVNIREGAILRQLRPSDASSVDSKWLNRSDKSLSMITRRLETQDPCCLGLERDGELCAFILRYEDGSLGMLHVEEAYRRSGYGTRLLVEATRLLEERGEPRVAYIVDGNGASEGLFAKQRWIREDPNAKKGTGKRRAKRKWIKSE
jgi:DTW domain-containing protein YfiP/ribosomal protein S18 acetylase RimI-like enzyme